MLFKKRKLVLITLTLITILQLFQMRFVLCHSRDYEVKLLPVKYQLDLFKEREKKRR